MYLRAIRIGGDIYIKTDRIQVYDAKLQLWNQIWWKLATLTILHGFLSI